MVDILRKRSDHGFEETVERVKRTCEEEGFTILMSKDMDAVFREKLGAHMERYTLILACAPDLAKRAMDVSRDVGLLMPCSFVVYEEDGEVTVAHTSIMRAAVEIGLAPEDRMEDIIADTGRRVRAIWERL